MSRSEDSDGLSKEGRAESSQRTPTGTRGPRAISRSACVHCKSLKVRCEFNPGETVCQRCQAGKHECLSHGRKKRKAAPTHEDLQEMSINQDHQIQSLLNQLEKLKTDKKISERVARAAKAREFDISASDPDSGHLYSGLDKAKRDRSDASAESSVSAYFPVEKGMHVQSPPDIIKVCALYPAEILELFSIYFSRINIFFSLLDPELHSPGKLIWTSPFLFTAICTTASRYYTARPSLYSLMTDFAKDAAGNALVNGSKSVEVCQAYLLLGVYPGPPKKKWAEDRSWLFMGIAIRMAIELELDQPPPAACGERECLNRTRTWLNCFCVDGSHAIQFGKLPMLRLDDYLARHSQDWYKSSALNIYFDIHLCGYVQIIILMAEFRRVVAETTSQQTPPESSLVDVCVRFDEKLSNLLHFWVARFEDDPNVLHPVCMYRHNMVKLIGAYLRLVVLALSFQNAVKIGISRDSYVFQKSMEVARTVIQIMTQCLYPTGYLRYAMEAHFLYAAFAASFLLNPKLLPLLDDSQYDGIITLVQALIEVLASKAVALDGRHSPALYSRFLSSLLNRHNVRPMAPSRDSNSVTADGPGMQSNTQRALAPNVVYPWPDITSGQGHNVPNVPEYNGQAVAAISHQSGEADMDFSLQHFLRTISAQDIPASGPRPGQDIVGRDPTLQGCFFDEYSWPSLQSAPSKTTPLTSV